MNFYKLNSDGPRSWWRRRSALPIAIVLTLLFSGTALAAEVLSGDPYILPRGEVVNDDLYVTGSEVIIDGTIEGDLVVAAGYVEVNGVVMGDVLAAGGAVVIAGVVQDDVRAAGGGVVIAGSVGDDLFAAAGGGWPGMAAMPMGVPGQGADVPQGLQVNAGASVGGDAYVVGGQGTVAGTIGGNLAAGMGTMTLAGRVAGDVDLSVENLTVADSTVVQGDLRYSAGNEAVIPPGTAASVTERPREEATSVTPERRPVRGFFMWLLRTVLIVAGYLLAGWLLWSFFPRQITKPTEIMETRPMEAGITGLLAVVAVAPVGAALTFLAVLFWNWFPGGAIMATFILGGVGFLWLFSPVVVGLWVGSKLRLIAGVPDETLPRLLLGIAAVVLVARVLSVVPCVGDVAFQVIYLTSLALSVGSWFLARRRPRQDAPLLPADAA